MTLQMTVETLEGMEEGISKLYVEKDGKFHLDVAGHDKNDDPNRIPKARLDQEIEKRRLSDSALEEIAKGFEDDIPEDLRELIPELPPAAKVKWIRNAMAKGLFSTKNEENSPDSKRPGGKAPANFEGMSPQAIMATGYGTKNK